MSMEVSKHDLGLGLGRRARFWGNGVGGLGVGGALAVFGLNIIFTLITCQLDT